MSTSVSAELLQDKLIEILEEAAFCFSEPLDESLDWDGEILVARMGYSGPEQGEVMLAVTEEGARQLAANLLGIDTGDPTTEDKATDAVGELLNIVVGAMIPDVFGTDALVTLGTPRVSRLTPEDYEGRRDPPANVVSLLLDEEHRMDIAAWAHEVVG